MRLTLCSTHARARAGWRCTHCERLLCADCVAAMRVGSTEVLSCVPCGGPPRELVRRRDEVPFLLRVPEAFVFPFKGAGLLTLVSGGVVLWLLGFGGWLGSVMSYGITWGYVFVQARATVNGSHEPEVPDVTEHGGVWGPVLRGLSTFVVWVPLAWRVTVGVMAGAAPEPPPQVVVLAPGAASEAELERQLQAAEGRLEHRAEPPRAPAPDGDLADRASAQLGPWAALRAVSHVLRDPLVWLCLVVGLLWWPLAFLLATTDAPFLSFVSPLVLVRLVARLGSDYPVLLGALVATWIAGGAVTFTAAAVGWLVPIPVVAPVLHFAASLYGQLVAGRVVGLLLYVRGADLGYLREAEAFEPLGPPMAPRGTRPLPAGFEPVGEVVPFHGEAASPEAPSQPPSLEVPGWSGAQVAMPAVRELELSSGDEAPLELEARPQAAPASLDALRAAIASRDGREAVRQYQALRGTVVLPPAALLEVGRAAASLKEDLVATHALTEASEAAEVAPTALALLGRVYLERFGDPARARHVFELLQSRFPGSSAASFAAAQLEALKAP